MRRSAIKPVGQVFDRSEVENREGEGVQLFDRELVNPLVQGLGQRTDIAPFVEAFNEAEFPGFAGGWSVLVYLALRWAMTTIAKGLGFCSRSSQCDRLFIGFDDLDRVIKDDRQPLQFYLLGTRKKVQAAIDQLHALRFSDPAMQRLRHLVLWSRPVPVPGSAWKHVA